MTPKNIALAEDVLARVRQLAAAEGKTPDELIEEAATKLLDARQTVGNLRSFVARNRQRAEAQGLKESDTPRLIAESRAERRR
ncbi:MAG: ribbon-helix-helix protein, CopG family [Vicinamibacterales bacterium]